MFTKENEITRREFLILGGFDNPNCHKIVRQSGLLVTFTYHLTAS